MNKRSWIEIVADILEATNGKGTTKTRIVYSANLNFKVASKYISFLVDKGYINKIREDGRVLYKITEKGRIILNAIQIFLTEFNE